MWVCLQVLAGVRKCALFLCSSTLGCAFPTEAGSGQTALNRLRSQVVLAGVASWEEADRAQNRSPVCNPRRQHVGFLSLRCLGGCSHAVPLPLGAFRVLVGGEGGAGRQVAIWQVAGPHRAGTLWAARCMRNSSPTKLLPGHRCPEAPRVGHLLPSCS